MMNIKSLLKAKAPIVAIPVEGHAPACIDGKRLRAWAKGVTIQSVRIVESEHEIEGMGLEEGHPPFGVKLPVGTRLLEVVGQAGHVKTRARFLIIARGAAIKTLSAWSDKESERLQKRSLTGALTTDQRKALKRAKFDEDGEGMIPVMVAGKLVTDPKTERMGVPVSIHEFPLLSFALIRFGTVADDNVRFTITEINTGQRGGAGDTPKQALLDARQKAAKLTPERIGSITAKCLAPLVEPDV
jgi:hypothetical protein